MIITNEQRDFIKWRLGELGEYGEQSRLNFEHFLYINDRFGKFSKPAELLINDTISMIYDELDRTHVNVYYVERLTEIALNKIRVARDRVGKDSRMSFYKLLRERDLAETQAKGLVRN